MTGRDVKIVIALLAIQIMLEHAMEPLSVVKALGFFFVAHVFVWALERQEKL